MPSVPPYRHCSRWIAVSYPHGQGWVTFAVGVDRGKVIMAPPIARWAIGKDERVAAHAWRELGAVFRDLPGDDAMTS